MNNSNTCCGFCAGIEGELKDGVKSCRNPSCGCHTTPAAIQGEDYKYSEHDHSHCWQSKKPPCGQRIEHLKCCLCEKLNPKVSSLLQREKDFVKKIDLQTGGTEADARAKMLIYLIENKLLTHQNRVI